MKNNLKIRSLGDKNPSKNENVKIKKFNLYSKGMCICGGLKCFLPSKT